MGLGQGQAGLKLELCKTSFAVSVHTNNNRIHLKVMADGIQGENTLSKDVFYIIRHPSFVLL